jgi:hypothetical protein
MKKGNLIAPEGKIIIEVDLEYKNSHTFDSGQKIRIERGYDNFNGRYTNPVNGIVINGGGLEKGTEIIIHHNSTHDTNKVFNYQHKPLCGIYSVPVDECYVYFDKTWKPFDEFSLGYRLFQPYKGKINGIQPTLIKNKIYVTQGEYAGSVVNTLKFADYELIFQDKNGKENRIIRIRNSGERSEVVAIDHDATNKLTKCELLIGINPNDAKLIYE